MTTTLGLIPGIWFFARYNVKLRSILLAGLLLPAAAQAQVSYTGTTANQNFASQPIGTPSGARTFSFSLSAGTTVGSVAVVTQGATNLDFTSATGTTCTTQTYDSAVNCIVNVTFNPRAAGGRMGAIVFFSGGNNAGTVIASVPVYGLGTGPQVGFYPSPSTSFTPSIEGSVGYWEPNSVAVDAAGDLFFTASSGISVAEVPAGSMSANVIGVIANGVAPSEPSGIAVDGAGNIFVADPKNNRVVEAPTGGGAPVAIGPTGNGFTLDGCKGVAVDGLGDLFIADSNHDRILEIPANGGAVISFDNPDGEHLNEPAAVAVDGAGNLFIADTGNNRVLEAPAGGGAAIVLLTGLKSPAGVAVDGAGDLFVSDTLNERVLEMPAGTSSTFVVGSGLYPYGVAVDGAGDLFVALTFDNLLLEQFFSEPPNLSFSTPTSAGSTDTIDSTKTVQIQNTGNQSLTLTALSYPTDFSQGSGASLCTGSISLSSGQECEVPIVFAPVQGGALSENVVLTDNALNVGGAQQSINVSGTALAPAVLTSPTPGTTLGVSNVTFTWTAGYEATTYTLWLGLNGVGSSNLYNSGPTTATSAIVTRLPAQGVTLYARLFSKVSGVWYYNDYTYKEASFVLAAIMSPTPGTTLGASNVHFTWTAGTGVTSYNLWLGLSGVGSSNLYNSGITTATSATVPALPANGGTIYARLFSDVGGRWESTDYTYTASTGALAAITSPSPGTTLGTSNVPFTWTAGLGVTHYNLWVGLNGVGSSNLYNSGVITNTSTTVPKIPAKGATVYVRLYSDVGGEWESTDYTYTEQ